MRQGTGDVSGFSLVEVVMAMGIVAIGMLPLVALLGTAMEASHEAFSRVANSRIGAELIGEVQQADWSDLGSWDGKQIRFDHNGQRLSGGSGDEAVFTARIRLPAASGGITLGTHAGSSNRHVRRVLVAVSSRPGPAGAQAIDAVLSGSEPPGVGAELFRAVVVNMETPAR